MTTVKEISLYRQFCLKNVREKNMADKSTLAGSKLKLILFRFTLVYLILYNFPAPVRGLRETLQYYDSVWETVTVWVSKKVFNFELVVSPFNGSSDTTFDYILIFCFFCFLVINTVIWTSLDRNRANHLRLYEFLYAYVR